MAKLWFSLAVLTLLQASELSISQKRQVSTPPLPILPIPKYSQLQWQQRELIMFIHFGVNTFTDNEWGSGHENPAIFNPIGLDAKQWVDAAAQAGIDFIILTAKHHDGFCLWPSKYTDHSVINSHWKNGHGDVVREFVNAAKAHGDVDIGFYLSPWDRHDPRYGHDLEYNEYYVSQLQELLNKYGSVKEVWIDGAKGANEPYITYYFSDWFSKMKEFQSSINIMSDAGPDLRWPGNEKGVAGSTCWSPINRTSLSIGNASVIGYQNIGDPKGTDWIPPECPVSIRPGWFWHKSESPKTLSELLGIYYTTVGRNCVMLLNVPPNSTGLFPETDVQRLKEFGSAIDTIFSTNLAENCSVKASGQRGDGFGPENVLDNDHLWTYWAPSEDDDSDEQWIEISGANGGLRFNVVRIQEAIGLGQRIIEHAIYLDGKIIANGTTVGYKKLHRLEDGVVQGQTARILVMKSKGLPFISSIGLHFDPFWNPKNQ